MAEKAEVALLIRLKDEASAALKELNTNLKTNKKAWEENYGAVINFSKQAGVAFLGTSAGIIAMLGLATKAAAEEEVSISRLQVAMENLGISYAANYEELDEWLQLQQEATAFSDTEQRVALSQIVRMTGNLAQAQDLVTLAMDMAIGTNRDLTAATQMLTYALGGNWGQVEQYIPALKKVQDEEEKWMLLRELFTGQSEAYGQTLEAQIQNIKNNITDLAEAIGNQLIPQITPLLEDVNEFLQKLEDTDPATLKLITNLGLAAAGFTGLAGGMLLTVGYLPNIINGFTVLATILHTTKLGVIALGAEITAIVGAFAGVSALLVELDKYFVRGGYEEGLESQIIAYAKLGDSAEAAAARVKGYSEERIVTSESEIEALEKLGYVLSSTTNAEDELTGAADEATAALNEETETAESVSEAAQRLIEQWEYENSIAGELGVTMKDIYYYLLDIGTETEVVAALYDKYGESTSNLTALLQEQGITLTGVANSLGSVRQAALDSLDAINAAIEEANQKLDESYKASTGGTLVGGTYMTWQEIATLPDEIQEALLGQVIQTGSYQLRRILDTYPTEVVNEYKDVFGDAWQQAITTYGQGLGEVITVEMYEAAKDYFEELGGIAQQGYEWNILEMVEQLASGVPQYQHGGPVMETGLAYVHKGETVVPAGSGRDILIHLTIPVQLENRMDGEEIERKVIKRIEKEVKIQGGF